MDTKTVIYEVGLRNNLHVWFDEDRSVGQYLDGRGEKIYNAAEYAIGTRLVVYCTFDLQELDAAKFDDDAQRLIDLQEQSEGGA